MNNEIKTKYNLLATKKYQGQYEYNRWFKDKLRQAGYIMTLNSIKKHFLNSSLIGESYLELGPGPGVWTKIFLKEHHLIKADLIEISSEMILQAKQNLVNYNQVNYYNCDFLDFTTDSQYDIFFSSRVFEYLINQAEAISLINKLLKSGGQGFIITKTPKYFRQRLLHRKVSKLHQGQIPPAYLKKLLQQSGFYKIKIYPVTMYFPLFKSVWLSRLLQSYFYRWPLNFISQFFCESYAIKFIKQ